MFIIGGALLAIINYNQFELLLAQYLYRVRPKEAGNKIKSEYSDGPPEDEHDNSELIGRVFSLRVFAFKYLCFKLCFKRTRNERIF